VCACQHLPPLEPSPASLKRICLSGCRGMAQAVAANERQGTRERSAQMVACSGQGGSRSGPTGLGEPVHNVVLYAVAVCTSGPSRCSLLLQAVSLHITDIVHRLPQPRRPYAAPALACAVFQSEDGGALVCPTLFRCSLSSLARCLLSQTLDSSSRALC
jgi:hypothetical protein